MALSGDKLRAHRQMAGMTQQDLAKKMGTTRPQISGWENEHRSPGLSRISRRSPTSLGFAWTTFWTSEESMSAEKTPVYLTAEEVAA